jgi:hypothetical protein
VQYVVEYRKDPNTLRLRLMCLLGERARIMRSAEEVPHDVKYGFVFKEWFLLGVTKISLFQYPGFLVVDIEKMEGGDWEEILQKIMRLSNKWEEISPRIHDPFVVWPYEDVRSSGPYLELHKDGRFYYSRV